jgi:tetratricopeptide (TPR) repeat protein
LQHFYKQAIEIDGNFATAYLGLAHAYYNMGADDLADESTRKAHELRDHADAIGKHLFEGTYYALVSRDVFKEIDALKRWENLRPNGSSPHNMLGLGFSDLGDFQNAEENCARQSE